MEVVVALAVLTALGLGGWYIWHKHHETKRDKPSNTGTSTSKGSTQQKPGNPQQTTDPSEGGKYLVLTEWAVRIALPSSLQGKVGYTLGDKVTDPDGNNIQAAKILLKNSDTDTQCAITKSSAGSFIDSAAQLLQVEKDKTFNTARYKGTFKANLDSDATHIYHLNYITPDCAGPDATAQIKELQTALERVQNL